CLAWPSRRVLLAGGPAGVTGATVTYGDATDPTTLHGLEPMGCWRRDRAHRCVPSKSPSRQGLPSMIGRALPGPSAGPGPSALSWARRALPATGIDLGWRLCTASMTYGKQASAIIDLETHSEPILPDWLTGLGGRVLDKAVAGLGAMRDAWRSYRLSMATAAGSMTHSHRARADALRADAADEAEQTLDTAMSRILSGRLDPVHAAAEAASEISAWPSPDQPSPFAPHNGVIPALRRRALLEDLSAAVLGPDMSYLTDVARAIAQETESLDHLARTALEQGWPSTALAHAYGKSASSVKRLRDHARATTVSAPGPDPRPDMMDARIRIQTLSQLLMDLCAQAEAQGKSMASIEQATGVSRMTLYRRRGHTDDGLWQVWMPEDTWADRHTPKATAHAVLAAMPETGPAQDRMERTLSSWSRDPRILTDRASGLRILPSATWDIRPDPPQDTDSQPAEHKKTQARPRKRRARVTTQEAQRIQSLYNAKQASVKELSTQYGVSVSTIYNIIRRGRE
ncbi:hypothetical protein, partial [Bifidobacterium actinocoloniiforme]